MHFAMPFSFAKGIARGKNHIFIRILFEGEHKILSDFSQFPPTDNPK
jgi:hypothetical protein